MKAKNQATARFAEERDGVGRGRVQATADGGDLAPAASDIYGEEVGVEVAGGRAADSHAYRFAPTPTAIKAALPRNR